MDSIFLFLILFLIGLVVIMLGWYIYTIKKEKEKLLEKEKLEDEIVNSLLELKRYTTESINISNEKLSNKFDLIEVALENDVTSITITSEEGLPIVSTIRNPDEISAKYSALFQRTHKLSKNKPKKISIKFENYYIHILPISINNVNTYAIIRSNFELDAVNEKKLIKDLLNVLEEYIPN